jgi:hypothetical protein
METVCSSKSYSHSRLNILRYVSQDILFAVQNEILSLAYRSKIAFYLCISFDLCFLHLKLCVLSIGFLDRLCGVVVRVPGYRSRDPVSIPNTARFSEKQWVWNGVHWASWVQLRSYLKEKVATPVWKSENTAVGIRHADHLAPSIRK